jgi:hypothetical protein
MAIEKLVELYEITEYRDGCVYRTAYRDTLWVDIDAKPDKGFQFAPVSDPTVTTVRSKRNPK